MNLTPASAQVDYLEHSRLLVRVLSSGSTQSTQHKIKQVFLPLVFWPSIERQDFFSLNRTLNELVKFLPVFQGYIYLASALQILTSKKLAHQTTELASALENARRIFTTHQDVSGLRIILDVENNLQLSSTCVL